MSRQVHRVGCFSHQVALMPNLGWITSDHPIDGSSEENLDTALEAGPRSFLNCSHEAQKPLKQMKMTRIFTSWGPKSRLSDF